MSESATGSATDAHRPLAGKEIVLCVSGGIAAYKAAELARLLIKADAEVQVVMTERAQHFVGALTFQALTGRPVFTDLFSLTQESQIGHIQIADAADLVVVAPATANTIARMAAGMADDALTAVVRATTAPILLAPSMNVNMWEDPITRDNLERLTRLAGVETVGPGAGFLACRWIGPGRLAEPPDIVEGAARMLTERDLDRTVVVISAGPTHEAIDPVRFVGNRSSGKMGYALAAAAARRGAEVKLISGPVGLAAPPGIEPVRVTDARAMKERVEEAAAAADVVIMAAAVADYRPRHRAPHKLKKSHAHDRVHDRVHDPGDDRGGDAIAIELVPNPDILCGLGNGRRDPDTGRPILVGFAAETENLIDNARQKLAQKNCDLVVANDVSQSDAGFAVDTNRVVLVADSGIERLELASKDAIAHRILDRVVSLLSRQPDRVERSRPK